MDATGTPRQSVGFPGANGVVINYVIFPLSSLMPQSYYHVLAASLYLRRWHPRFEEIGVDFGWVPRCVTIYYAVATTEPRRSHAVPLKKGEDGSFTLLHKISRTACCFGIRTLLKQYDCYESATIWYTDHQYLAQYSEIINNLQEIPLMFAIMLCARVGLDVRDQVNPHVMSCRFQI